MKGFLFAFLVFFSITLCLAQKGNLKKHLTFDYQLVVENDAFTLDMTKDQYYSSGIFAAVRWLGDSTGKAKIIRSAQLNHRMFTPSWIGWENQVQLDRPYAGLLSASLIQEYYFHSNQYLKAHLELGWMGPGALVGETQTIWHQWFNMPEPKGWTYQINDTPIVNLYMTYVKPVYSSYHFELTAESNVGLGSVFNYFRQELMIRMGKLRPVYQSAYTGSSLGNQRQLSEVPVLSEIYVFYSPGLEYVYYNATIEGNFIGERSTYTEESIHWITQHRVGIMFSWTRFDLGVIAHWRTRENTDATNHSFVGVRLNQRF